jgi:hypothetical protein
MLHTQQSIPFEMPHFHTNAARTSAASFLYASTTKQITSYRSTFYISPHSTFTTRCRFYLWTFKAEMVYQFPLPTSKYASYSTYLQFL